MYMEAIAYRNTKRMILFIHSPIDDGSGFIDVRWARHLDFGHGVTVQALSIATLLLMGGGVVIAVAARRLLRSDAATRSATERIVDFIEKGETKMKSKFFDANRINRQIFRNKNFITR